MARWRQAGAALARVRLDELRRLTDAEALVAADELLDLIRLLPPPTELSGLIEQQRLFASASMNPLFVAAAAVQDDQ